MYHNVTTVASLSDARHQKLDQPQFGIVLEYWNDVRLYGRHEIPGTTTTTDAGPLHFWTCCWSSIHAAQPESGQLPSDWPCKRDPLMDQMMDQLRSRPVARPTDGPRLWQPWCRQPRQMLTRLTWMSAWRGWQHNRGASDRCWPDLRGYGQRKINGPDGIWFILVLVFSLSGVVVGRANINNDKVLRLFTSDGSL